MNTQPLGGRPDEDDPTGVRALLRGLPEPGPMPDELMRRISARLAEEQQERASSTTVTRLPFAGDVAPPAPTTPAPPVLSPPAHAPTGTTAWSTSFPATAPEPQYPTQFVPAQGGPGATPVDELAARRRRRQRVTALVGVAAALVLAVGGGSMFLAQDQGKSTATAAPTGVSAPGDKPTANEVTVLASGKDYQGGSFTADATALRDGKTTNDDGALAGRSDAQAAKDNPAKLAPCTKGLMDDLLARPDAVTVDFAKYEGRDAMIVVMRRGGTTTAWAVGAGCTVNRTNVLAGPTTLDA